MAQVAQGRQDWQRTGQADSTQLIADTGTLNTGNRTIGPFYIAGFSALEGLIQGLSGGFVAVEIDYWGDQARTQLMGSRTLAVDSTAATSAQLFTPSLGPWVSITFRPTNGATVWSARIFLAATTRQPNGLVLPTGAPLVVFNNLVINAGASTALMAFSEIFAGPVTLSIVSTAVGALPTVAATTSPGVTARVLDADFSATTRGVVQTHLPALPCTLQVFNNAAAAITVFGAVVPSLTGG